MRTAEAGPRLKPHINPRIAQILLPLGDEARRELEASILAEGVRDPIVVWMETGDLLDGRTRLEIVEQHGLPFPNIRELSFPDEEAAKRWVLTNQLGRRNLTPKEASLLRGQLAEMRKRNDRENLRRGKQEAPVRKSCGPEDQPQTTAEVIAAAAGVSPRTVDSDARFARSVKAIAEKGGEEVAHEAVKGSLRQNDVNAFAAAPGPKSLADLRAFASQVERERKPRAPRENDQRPFFQRTAKPKTLETYVDPHDGNTYADRVQLVCGHWHQFKRRRPALCGKSYPCEPCGSGTRRPHEKRLNDVQRRRAWERALLDPALREELYLAMVAADLITALPQQDERGQHLVDEISSHLLKAGMRDRERAGSRRHAAEEE